MGRGNGCRCHQASRPNTAGVTQDAGDYIIAWLSRSLATESSPGLPLNFGQFSTLDSLVPSLVDSLRTREDSILISTGQRNRYTSSQQCGPCPGVTAPFWEDMELLPMINWRSMQLGPGDLVYERYVAALPTTSTSP